jgi:hypothetical protein
MPVSGCAPGTGVVVVDVFGKRPLLDYTIGYIVLNTSIDVDIDKHFTREHDYAKVLHRLRSSVVPHRSESLSSK